jgi:hypothetical protein
MSLEFTRLHPQLQALLETLLERAEQPTRQRAVRVRLTPQTHSWYYDRYDLGLRSRIHGELKWLAEQKWLTVSWQKYEVENELAMIEFCAHMNGSLETFYQFCGRPSRSEQEKALQDLLLAYLGKIPATGENWFVSFVQYLLEQLVARRSLTPLNPDDPTGNRDLLHALDALAELSSPTLERKLSVLLFNDSKRLEDLRPQLLAALRHFSPHAATAGIDEWDLLRAHHLHRPHVLTMLAGPLVLRQSIEKAGALLDLTAWPSGLGLPDELLRSVDIVACPARAIRTIENLTSYHELLLRRPSDLLVIYSGGFPHPTLLTLLLQLQAADPALPFYHWGDIDLGGLRILLHLRQHLATVHTLAMRSCSLAEAQVHTRPLGSTERSQLHQLTQEPLLADCRELIAAMLKHNQKLEQEALEIAAVLAELTESL